MMIETHFREAKEKITFVCVRGQKQHLSIGHSDSVRPILIH